MATYKIKPVEQTLAEQRAKQANPTPTTTSTTPKQTVQIKSPSGTNMTVGAGSQMHQNYLKNNPSAIDQSSVKTTYSTPDVYHHSEGIKSFDQNGQQTSSISGYQGATTPTFNVTSDITNLVNTVKNQEGQMRNVWANGGGDYNALIRDRNNQTGQLIDAIMKASGGNASLGEIESILGRRLENQEMQSYREQYSNGSTLQQSQLNNTWEHDFSARNNGENNQYLLNYLNNGTGGEVLSESTMNYINSLSPEALANYTQGQSTGLTAMQDYFNQRATGWTPEYVNNTYNPLPWGEVDAGDVINNGGAGTQQQYQDYLWQLANPNYDYSTMTPSPIDMGLSGLTGIPQAQSPINLNVTNQSPAMDLTSLMGLLNTQTTPSQLINSQGNLSTQSTQDDVLSKYLQQVFLGGI